MKLKIEKKIKNSYKNNIYSNYKTAGNKLLFFMALVSTIILNSCKKEIETIPKLRMPADDKIEALDYQRTLSIISQILNIKCKLQDLSPSDFFEISSSSHSGILNKDSILQKRLPNGDTLKVIIDFDETAAKIRSRSLIYCFSGTPDNYGNTKEGRLIYKINSEKLFLDSGMTCNIVIQNFKINGNKVNGIITIENRGKASYSISTQHFKVTIAGKTVEITEGLFTKIDSKNCRYELTGQASIISSFGAAFNAVITETVIVDTDCRWGLVAGNVELNIPNQSKKSINFGKGDCDPFASITIDNLKIPIIL